MDWLKKLIALPKTLTVDWVMKRHVLPLLAKLNWHKTFIGGAIWLVSGVVAYLGGPDQVSWWGYVLPAIEALKQLEPSYPPISTEEVTMAIGHLVWLVGIGHRLLKWLRGDEPPATPVPVAK